MTVEPALVCDLERGFPISVVRASGPLSYASTPILRGGVHKAIADQPELILVDVADLIAVDDLALTVLPMLARQAGADGIAMIVISPTNALLQQLDELAITRWVQVAGSRSAAIALHARAPSPPVVDVVLPPIPSATADARRLVDETCRRWRVADLADTAALIVTELIANGIQHAGTPLRLSLTLRERHLHVSVRDGSAHPPRRTTADEELESGRGLLIIEALAAAWGFVTIADGKVVWVTLRRTLPARRSGQPGPWPNEWDPLR